VYWLLRLAGRAQTIYLQTELTELPAPTEAVLILADHLRLVGVWNFMAMVLAMGILSIVTLRGRLDGRLRTLLIVNVVLLSLLVPAWVISVLLPMSGNLGPFLK
jgi:hypothetical protein